MSTRNQRVLITGAAGRLGSVVAALFHDRGADVLATDVQPPGEVPYRFRQADLLDHAVALDLLDGIEVVLHIGNLPGIGPLPPQTVFNHNVTINQNVFQGAAEQGVGCIVFASTLQLIGSHVDDRTVVTPPTTPIYPMTGDTIPDPSNVYALSKTVSETMLRYYAERCGIASTALRFPLLHNGEDWRLVTTGDETFTDVFEGFTALTYRDAAALFAAVVDADLAGYHCFMAGRTERHRDLSFAELLDRHYPDVDSATDDLIDVSAVTAATGWQPSEPPTSPKDQPT